MKVLIIQENFSPLGNFRECFSIKAAFERKGHSVSIWGKGHADFHEESLNMFLVWCDVILVIEQYSFEWIPKFTYASRPIFYWSIDTHTNFDRHLEFCKKMNIKNIATAVYGCDVKFKENKTHGAWIPNGYPKDLIDDLKLNRPFELGYCGSYYKDRWADFNIINKYMHVRLDVMVRQDDMVGALNSYQMAWNKNYSSDVNYRTFEATGAGCMLLTNKTPGLEFLFDIGKHIVVYSDVKDCIAKAKYYVENKEKMQEIALAGYNHVRANHSFDNRVDEFLKFFEKAAV